MIIEKLDELRDELSIKSKNGFDFTLAASIIWLVIAYLWTLKLKSYDKSIIVFIVGAPLLPLAFLFSKLFKTNWKIPNNRLQPLGLWLNFAQLLYFPFLVLILIKMPDYFIVTYAIITGGHLFPYAWLYKTNWYAIFAVVIVLGVLLLGLNLPNDKMYVIAVFTSILLFVLSLCLYNNAARKQKASYE